jgi:hypothetical protein
VILDSLLQFDPSQSLAVGAGTLTSLNTIDLGLGQVGGVAQIPSFASGGGARDIGIGDDPAVKVLVEIIVSATSAGTTTMQVQVQGAPDNGSGAPGTFTTYAQSAVLTLVSGGTLAAPGTVGSHFFDIDVPRVAPGVAIPRFLRLQYVMTGTGTGGAVESMLVLDRFDQIVSAAGNLSGYVPGVTVPN